MSESDSLNFSEVPLTLYLQEASSDFADSISEVVADSSQQLKRIRSFLTSVRGTPITHAEAAVEPWRDYDLEEIAAQLG
jgi:hypothetical protein